MEQEEQTLFIWLLEYGVRTNDRKVNCRDMLNAAHDDGVITGDEDSKAAVLRNLFYEAFDFKSMERENAIRTGRDKWHTWDSLQSSLKAEYYFRLVEFEELKLARETARQAHEHSMTAQKLSEASLRESKRAFRFSVGALLVSAGLAIFNTAWQLLTPVKIDSEQMDSVVRNVQELKVSVSQTSPVQIDPTQIQQLIEALKSEAVPPASAAVISVPATRKQ